MNKDTPEAIAAFEAAAQQNTTIQRLSCPGSNDKAIMDALGRNASLARH